MEGMWVKWNGLSPLKYLKHMQATKDTMKQVTGIASDAGQAAESPGKASSQTSKKWGRKHASMLARKQSSI